VDVILSTAENKLSEAAIVVCHEDNTRVDMVKHHCHINVCTFGRKWRVWLEKWERVES